MRMISRKRRSRAPIVAAAAVALGLTLLAVPLVPSLRRYLRMESM